MEDYILLFVLLGIFIIIIVVLSFYLYCAIDRQRILNDVNFNVLKFENDGNRYFSSSERFNRYDQKEKEKLSVLGNVSKFDDSIFKNRKFIRRS